MRQYDEVYLATKTKTLSELFFTLKILLLSIMFDSCPDISPSVIGPVVSQILSPKAASTVMLAWNPSNCPPTVR